ncbi:hypothetical protein BKA67DRAFT_202122 [Truncatella angustata]|uniref:Vacuolar protein sorting-associated protein 62 n=1 Tax=Truncatella angustata TaxID=152316 RepID=A0A9P8UTF9_9PEZI|nr:uncharacterized protein BKA67DRAFT_202122 [Truncatella angustata]KAH6657894.1 hypothetical protein BKA67DRAFT_202122 [Truncatella angustata]KAH8196284.1 hypothetical protein TruAng_009532 [Truncatella angustata]
MTSIGHLLCLSSLAWFVVARPSRLPKRDVLPDYAITYAPISYLFSGEKYFPSDVATHLQNVVPEVDYVAVGSAGSVNVNNLNSYNNSVYLTADSTPSDSLPWITSDYGKPDNSTGYSGAPGTIIAVTKNATTTDVFYFHFYSYNYGGTVLDINFDDHVGDWEHVMIRFVDGEPYAVYHSQHGAGSAYYWDVMNFDGGRPITYIATGSHANYATAGTQDYTVALGLVSDHTDAGYGWDITQNYRGYWYDVGSGEFSIAGGASTGGTEEATETADWLLWQGYWGDEQYPTSHFGQYCLFGECHYTSGPTGPVAKNLGRTAVCQTENDCVVFDDINDLTHQSKRRRSEDGIGVALRKDKKA